MKTAKEIVTKGGKRKYQWKDANRLELFMERREMGRMLKEYCTGKDGVKDGGRKENAYALVWHKAAMIR